MPTLVTTSSSAMAETVRLWRAVHMPKKFIVQLLSAVVMCQVDPSQNMFVYVATSAFFEGGGSLSANISQGRGHCPPTSVGVRKLE